MILPSGKSAVVYFEQLIIQDQRLVKKNHKKCSRHTFILIPPFIFNLIHWTFSSLIQRKWFFYIQFRQVLQKKFDRKDNGYYRWVACYASNSTLDQRNQVRHRPAEVVIPWTLPLPFIKIMKSGSLYWATISTGLRTPDTVIRSR